MSDELSDLKQELEATHSRCDKLEKRNADLLQDKQWLEQRNEELLTGKQEAEAYATELELLIRRIKNVVNDADKVINPAAHGL